MDYKKDNNHSSFGEFIYDLVNDFYSNYILKGSKPQSNQWTIISAIIMENNNKYKIICYSNGTKSLPNINYKSRKFQIFDCHTEILTLRCFKFFLLNCLYFHLDKENKNNFLTKEEHDKFKLMPEFYDIFEYSQSTEKYKIKKGINFHLYISENPCGECSNILYNINNQRNIKEMTGSKILEECLNYINNKNKPLNNKDNNNKKDIENISKDKKYYFRTKSIRSDFKLHNLSFSLSCTDKIMLRNILGYQGKYLSFLIESIFLKSLIINNGLDNNNNNKDIIEKFYNCINYNKRHSINKVNIKEKECIMPEIYFINHKNKNEENSLKGNCKNDKNALTFSAYWYFPNSIKKVDPSNGIKTGGNLKDLDKLDFLRVKISNYDLSRNIYNLIIDNKREFNADIKKIEKYILNNKEDVDFNDIISSLVCEDYKNMKNDIIEENKELKDFIGKKRNIFKK